MLGAPLDKLPMNSDALTTGLQTIAKYVCVNVRSEEEALAEAREAKAKSARHGDIGVPDMTFLDSIKLRQRTYSMTVTFSLDVSTLVAMAVTSKRRRKISVVSVVIIVIIIIIIIVVIHEAKINALSVSSSF